MTTRDPMPFGKYKGTAIDDVPEDYLDWLVEQDWMSDPKGKWVPLYKLLTGDTTCATPKENQNIVAEDALLLSMSTPFRKWWFAAYGDKLRLQGELNYIPFLRVAINSWCAAEANLGHLVTAPTPVNPSLIQQANRPVPFIKPTPQPLNPVQPTLDDDTEQF